MNLKCVLGMHAWSGCKCGNCGKTRANDHDWTADCEKCANCGMTRIGAHTWNECECTKCQKPTPAGHHWTKDGKSCTKCGKLDPFVGTWREDIPNLKITMPVYEISKSGTSYIVEELRERKLFEGEIPFWIVNVRRTGDILSYDYTLVTDRSQGGHNQLRVKDSRTLSLFATFKRGGDRSDIVWTRIETPPPGLRRVLDPSLAKQNCLDAN